MSQEERPTIGIAAAVELVDTGPWRRLPAVVQDLQYTRAVQRAGGRVFLLPPDPEDTEDASAAIERLDGLVLAGGSDLDPRSYGAEPHPETAATNAQRDAYEIALTRAALERDLPLLAICRGFQIMNVARGGTVEQHLPDRLSDEGHRPVPGAWAQHGVRVDPDSRVGAVVGEHAEVHSHHHQGLGELGEGLRPVAWSEEDEVIEAVEDPEKRFALGVLWHPEQVEERLIEELVAAAKRRRGT